MPILPIVINGWKLERFPQEAGQDRQLTAILQFGATRAIRAVQRGR
jgi:hypothetical protein